MANWSIEYLESRPLKTDATSVVLALWCDGNLVHTHDYSVSGERRYLFATGLTDGQFRLAWCDYAAAILKAAAKRHAEAGDDFAAHVDALGDGDVKAICRAAANLSVDATIERGHLLLQWATE